MSAGIVESAGHAGAERADAGITGPGRVHHGSDEGRPPESRGIGARHQREPVLAALLDHARADAAEDGQRRLVVEPRQEAPRLLPARREQVDPSDQLQKALALGGGEDLARVDDDARPTSSRPRDLTLQGVGRHRRQHHHRDGDPVGETGRRKRPRRRVPLGPAIVTGFALAVRTVDERRPARRMVALHDAGQIDAHRGKGVEDGVREVGPAGRPEQHPNAASQCPERGVQRGAARDTPPADAVDHDLVERQIAHHADREGLSSVHHPVTGGRERMSANGRYRQEPAESGDG